MPIPTVRPNSPAIEVIGTRQVEAENQKDGLLFVPYAQVPTDTDQPLGRLIRVKAPSFNKVVTWVSSAYDGIPPFPNIIENPKYHLSEVVVTSLVPEKEAGSGRWIFTMSGEYRFQAVFT